MHGYERDVNSQATGGHAAMNLVIVTSHTGKPISTELVFGLLYQPARENNMKRLRLQITNFSAIFFYISLYYIISFLFNTFCVSTQNTCTVEFCSDT